MSETDSIGARLLPATHVLPIGEHLLQGGAMNVLPNILGSESMGWAAALLTLLTFVCADMRRLRLLALAANAAFITYGSMAHVLPVLVLHLTLVPVNLWRLNEAFRRQAPTEPAGPAPTQRTGRQPGGWNSARRRTRFSGHSWTRGDVSQTSRSKTTAGTGTGSSGATCLAPDMS